MKRILLVAGLVLGITTIYAGEWVSTPFEDGVDRVNSVSLNSQSQEETITIYRKSPKRAGMSPLPKEMVFIKFKTDSIDQVYARGPIIYKADKGKAYPLGSNSRLSGFTGSVETSAFHGKSSATCGIIGNIINSDKLTVRYETTGKQIKDVVFDLPKNNDPLYSLLGFDKSKDCIEIN